MLEAGHSKPVLWDDPGGWRGVQGRGRVYTRGRVMSVYCPNHHNTVKKLAFNQNKYIKINRNQGLLAKKRRISIIKAIVVFANIQICYLVFRERKEQGFWVF